MLKKIYYKLFKSKDRYNKFKLDQTIIKQQNLFEEKFKNKLFDISNSINNKKTLNFLHSGHCGDLIYSLALIKELSKSHQCNLFIGVGKNIRDVRGRFNELLNYFTFINKKNVNYYRKKINKVSSKKEESLKNILQKNPLIKKFILKVDIEGSEFNIIDEIINFSKNIDMLIIEFHDLDKQEKRFHKEILKLINHFDIIHIHGNNHCNLNNYGLPIAIELTLLNKNYNLEKIEEKISFPLRELDYPNNPKLEDIKFTFK